MKLTDTIKWIATLLVLVGSSLTSFKLYEYNVQILTLGSVLFLIWSIRVRDRALILVNAGLLLIYFIGLFKG